MTETFKLQIENKSTDELLFIYRNPDDYQEAYVNLVFAELQNRNAELGNISQEVEEERRAKKEKMIAGRPGNEFYIVICFILALLGGFIGIIGGIVYSQSTQRDPYGEKHYVYDEATRKKGVLIIVIGIIMISLLVLWRSGDVY
jgi:uncharacterized membrane protein